MNQFNPTVIWGYPVVSLSLQRRYATSRFISS